MPITTSKEREAELLEFADMKVGGTLHELFAELYATRDLALELVSALEYICRLGHSKFCRAHYAEVSCDCGYEDGCAVAKKARAQLAPLPEKEKV